MTASPQEPNVIAQRLHLATGFLESERDWIVRRLAALGPRLRSFREIQVDLEISLKDRRGAGQQVTLECWIRRTPSMHLVATSSVHDLSAALNDVRNGLIRQIDDAKTRTEPHSNRTLRHPEATPSSFLNRDAASQSTQDVAGNETPIVTVDCEPPTVLPSEH
jgi:ribosome-associated translation inhibitor RaiA